MKVCSSPITAPTPDYANCNLEAEQVKEKAYFDALKAKLIEMGYTGEHTGKILRERHADGYAQYMLADAPRQSKLIHLAVDDAWDSPNVRHLPKREVLRRIAAEARLRCIFDKARR